MGSGEPGRLLLAGAVAVLCAVCALAAYHGVLAHVAAFFGPAGMLPGIGAARFLLPRGDWGQTGRDVLLFVAMGGIFAGSYLPVLDLSTIRGVFFWAAYLGFWPVAVRRLTEPPDPRVDGR